jgi:nucleoside-diphosphate kinase
MLERTLSIVKPDAVKKGLIGTILGRLEAVNLKIIAEKMVWLSPAKAREFYAVHADKPFYNSLVEFMASGPVLVTVLEGENAIGVNRNIMGATDPAKAALGTIRKDFAESIERNAVHGSDAPETAKVEIAHFFPGLEIFDYESVKRWSAG